MCHFLLGLRITENDSRASSESFLNVVQVKELGAVVYNCSCLAADLGKIFEAYWLLGDSQSVPSPWPSSFSTPYNKDTPLQLPLNGTPSHVYLSVRHCAAVQRRDHMVVSYAVLLIPLSLSEFASFPVCSWQDSRPSVHPQCHGGRPQLHLHRCHELPAHHGVLPSQKVERQHGP